MSSLDELFTAHGVRVRPLRTAIALLCAGWLRFDDLVRRSAAPRRSTQELLDALGDAVERGPRGLRIHPKSVADLRPWAQPVPAEPGAEQRTAVERLVDAVPPPLAALDHVQATSDTVLRRALWLDEEYDLRRTPVLFLGDHDVTSLAVHSLRPDADLTVVDLDERVLEYVDRHSGGAVRTLHADLRIGLPPAVTGWAGVVFSDPPYTPEGMGLFAQRALEALADPPRGAVVLAYGYSPRHPALGLQVQRELLELGLTFEAVLPGFSRYTGAQAIGSAADQYVLQPTAKARKAGGRKRGIYTHGPQSVESAGTPPELLDRLRELAGDGAELRQADWSTARPGRVVAVDLTADPGPWLLRVLLGTNAERLAVLVANNHPDIGDAAAQASLSGLVAGKYRLRYLRSNPDSRHAVVLAEAVPDADPRLLKVHARLRNLLPGTDGDHRLIDVPRHRLAELLA
ncbi:bis-aminopropyl spermidine synthase family protein [Amycolatopsis suaedae]|uniref:Putative methyltransferase n=1 Tax=Amycolatopsis suaedae TaxID=2510978 RepID=A0A4V2EL90_9PSEU|nr:bis-aminopropyl spermidine synthase family protein [Amycolatopsis suaedae]RZQ60735.1 putative methyltransferase [Amycolatopsis suaedae]